MRKGRWFAELFLHPGVFGIESADASSGRLAADRRFVQRRATAGGCTGFTRGLASGFAYLPRVGSPAEGWLTCRGFAHLPGSIACLGSITFVTCRGLPWIDAPDCASD